MSDNHFTNIFHVTGNNNTVNVRQDIDASNGGADMLGMVLKFLGMIILSPVLIPLILGMNGYKMIQDQRNGGDDHGNQ